MAQDIKEKYINPYTDFGFKKLFGSAQQNRELTHQLNLCIKIEEKFGSLRYLLYFCRRNGGMLPS